MSVTFTGIFFRGVGRGLKHLFCRPFIPLKKSCSRQILCLACPFLLLLENIGTAETHNKTLCLQQDCV